MRKGLRSTLLFHQFSQIHLSKDPGFVMHYLAPYGRATILCTKNGPYNLKKFRPTLHFLPKPFFLSALWYLWRNAKDIDLLVMFHTHPLNIIYGPLYKIRNPKGITYIKADMDNRILDLPKPGIINYIRRIKIWLNLWHVDHFSVEQEQILKLLTSRYRRFAAKLFHVPNGYGDYISVAQLPLAQKENMIFCVGPVGSMQKGTEYILETAKALQKDLGDWKFVLAGRIVEEYQSILEDFFQSNPKLKDKIILKGHVSDRKDMLDLYRRAKILFMPSRFETFSCALTEAAHYGNVIVGTPVGGVAELTDNGRIGAMVPFGDVKAMAAELRKRMRNQQLLQKESAMVQQRCDAEYTWTVISKRIVERISRP
jgi:L-malate glycosyltransferase